jgi:N6-adenosine-specific RNA methylase IME4
MQLPIEPDEHKPLALYDAACRALAEAVAVNEVMAIRDEAAQLAAAARVANNHQAEADAVALRMRATRRLGQLMQAQKESVGFASGGEHGGRRRIDGSRANPSISRPTLAIQGIGKHLAHQARVFSAPSDEAFENKVTDVRDKVARAVRNAAREIELEQEREVYRARTYEGGTVADLEALIATGFRAGVICPDFPWPFLTTWSSKGTQRSADRHYEIWPLERIKAFASDFIPRLAAPDCALFIWTIWPLIFETREVIEACGFKYSGLGFDWTKTTPNTEAITIARAGYKGGGLHWGEGHVTRANSEVCLLALRGNPLRLSADVHSSVIAPVGEHSEKPDEVYRRIKRLYRGPFLEMFARRQRPGWTCWGNEIPPPAAEAAE